MSLSRPSPLQAIKGIVVMSAELESMFNSFTNNQVSYVQLLHRQLDTPTASR